MPPTTRGRILFAPALFACAFACAGEQGTGPEGREWVLSDLPGRTFALPSLHPSQRPTLIFADGRVSGRGVCNPVMAKVAIDGDQMTFGPIGRGGISCPRGKDLERFYLEALRKTTRWAIEGETLKLTGTTGKTLTFTAKQ